MYQLVITDADGQTTASRPLTKQGALDCFDIITDVAAEFDGQLPSLRPDGGGHMRVVTERECAAILAIAGRADR